MLSNNNTKMHSSYSLMTTSDTYICDSKDETLLTITSNLIHRSSQPNIHLPNIVIFIITFNQLNFCQCQKRLSIDSSLLSYSFLVGLINRLFNLHSNFLIKTKHNFVITDDFELDGCIMNHVNESIVELTVDRHDKHHRRANETNANDNYELIETENDCVIATIKSITFRPETLFKKATSWLHSSTNTTANKCLTKKEFLQMLDHSNGRLLNIHTFRQRIYDSGCEESIRSTVWYYLFRIFNETMTNEDKNQYQIKVREQYDAMKQTWQNKNESEIIILENLIQKDVTRTDSTVKFFDNKKNLSRQKLLNILMNYCIYHPEPGYVQGMTDMVAPILYVINDEPLAYACFCALMHYMSPLFHPDGIAMNRRLDLLRKTIRAIDIELWHKIEQCDIGNLMFAYRWLLLDCKREFPFKDISRVFETLWASLPIDRFEFTNVDDFSSLPIVTRRRLSTISSVTNTILSSGSNSLTPEDIIPSEHSSIDAHDSDYREEHSSSAFDLTTSYSKQEKMTIKSSIPLERWLTNFSSIDNDNDFSDMFTIFLCMAILEQNRSSIMHISTSNVDNDDQIGCYFARLARKNDAQQALQLARHYHRQYVLFQMRMKQLLLIAN
ncbi:unnamed protein product [Rotaria magnacalcarata]|uniref:Rab-GAP TBC domain-containing protein n=1 Tax=Rotaria magnacalcarata TaxID=392030 RepID=A0A819ZHE8_9BILA|nr:unnamed protein product [Rotaria magnacalcarata]